MTKEEALNKIIEYCKNGSKTPLSDFCIIPCSICPFNDDNCENVIADVLTERLIKAEEQNKSFEKTCYKLQQALEEKKETNLEHYASYYNNYDHCIYMDVVKLTNETHRRLNNFEDAIEWLLEPYKPPKPKFKLTQLEHDLLDYCSYKQGDDTLKDWTVLMDMQNKGHYKDIPTDVPIKDILDNCEVVEE